MPRRRGGDFSWSADRRLVWDDFRGPIPFGKPPMVAAETSCGIGYKTEISSSGEIDFTVYNHFSVSKSWVRAEARKPEILEHEQGHFDLCELYTRELRFQLAAISARNMREAKAEIQEAWTEVYRVYLEQQAAYERDTQHGINRRAQIFWTAELAKQLDQTAYLAAKPIVMDTADAKVFR